MPQRQILLIQWSIVTGGYPIQIHKLNLNIYLFPILGTVDLNYRFYTFLADTLSEHIIEKKIVFFFPEEGLHFRYFNITSGHFYTFNT